MDGQDRFISLLLWDFCSGKFCVLLNFAFQLPIVGSNVDYIMSSYLSDIITMFFF